MQYSIYFVLVIISFLASLTAYFQKNVQFYLRLFPVFILLTIIIELFAGWLSRHGTAATPLYNFFSCVEFLFYMYILKEIILNARIKKIILYVMCVYALLGIINVLFIQKGTNFNSVTYALGCLLIAVFCIFYFFELFQSINSVNLATLPAFWICTGLLFYYTCSFPLWGLANFLRKVPLIITRNIQVILLLLNVFLYSSFTIAFLCRIRARNSTS